MRLEIPPCRGLQRASRSSNSCSRRPADTWSWSNMHPPTMCTTSGFTTPRTLMVLVSSGRGQSPAKTSNPSSPTSKTVTFGSYRQTRLPQRLRNTTINSQAGVPLDWPRELEMRPDRQYLPLTSKKFALSQPQSRYDTHHRASCARLHSQIIDFIPKRNVGIPGIGRLAARSCAGSWITRYFLVETAGRKQTMNQILHRLVHDEQGQ